jgi:hypothetical protein
MTNFDEMEQFVNWDKAIDAFQYPQDDNTLAGLAADNENIDLVLGNVSEDDFSFCALQQWILPQPPMISPVNSSGTRRHHLASTVLWPASLVKRFGRVCTKITVQPVSP